MLFTAGMEFNIVKLDIYEDMY